MKRNPYSKFALPPSASIVEIAERYGVEIDRRKSKPASGDFWARCCFHEERSASLHLKERGAESWFKCFGCGEGGDLITFHRKLTGGSFRAAVEAIGGGAHVEPDPELLAAREQAKREREAEAARQRLVRRASAQALYYSAGVHVSGTPGEAYMRGPRNIGAALGGAELRFHPRAPLSPYEPHKAGRCAAIVAPIRDAAGEQIGAHVTFIKADGSGKQCFDHLGGDARMIVGDHVGGFIRLGRVRDECVIGEGWESALSASEACGLPALASINAANMRALVLPASVRRVVIAYDRGAVGELSAEALAERLTAAGLAVEMFGPPEGCGDWNDAAQASRREGVAA
jgi:phage/plasmid primase-like uncharacterized protein